MLLSLIHPVSSLSVELETTHPDHTAPAELTRTQHLEAVTLLRYEQERGAAEREWGVCVCLGKLLALSSYHYTGYVLCAWEGGKEGRDKKKDL